jgi:hypothetical protein
MEARVCNLSDPLAQRREVLLQNLPLALVKDSGLRVTPWPGHYTATAESQGAVDIGSSHGGVAVNPGPDLLGSPIVPAAIVERRTYPLEFEFVDAAHYHLSTRHEVRQKFVYSGVVECRECP